MPAVDTNVLVRHLVQDHPAQAAAAATLFKQAAARGEVLFVALTVALELEWVLRSRYRFCKQDVLNVFSALLESRELQFQSEAVLEQALNLYRAHTADFADCMHVGACQSDGHEPMLTFDRKAQALPGVQAA